MVLVQLHADAKNHFLTFLEVERNYHLIFHHYPVSDSFMLFSSILLFHALLFLLLLHPLPLVSMLSRIVDRLVSSTASFSLLPPLFIIIIFYLHIIFKPVFCVERKKMKPKLIFISYLNL